MFYFIEKFFLRKTMNLNFIFFFKKKLDIEKRKKQLNCNKKL